MGARLRGQKERSGVGMKRDGERRKREWGGLTYRGEGGGGEGWGCRQRKVGVMEEPRR